jgi:hypothetical protein
MAARKHIVYLTEEEINAMRILCRASITMSKDSPFFTKIEEESKAVLEKLDRKAKEIDGS